MFIKFCFEKGRNLNYNSLGEKGDFVFRVKIISSIITVLIIILKKGWPKGRLLVLL